MDTKYDYFEDLKEEGGGKRSIQSTEQDVTVLARG